jgi:signal transduction histidine kinase
MHSGTWVALAPVVTAAIVLVTLAAVPWTISSKLKSVRHDTNVTILPARQMVREIAAALALEVSARDYASTWRTPELERHYSAAIAIERSRDSALNALAPRLGHRLERDVSELRALTAKWHADRIGNAVDDSASLASLTDVLASAAHLDSALGKRQQEQSARIQSLEAVDILLPSVLVPLLAAVLVAIYWTGRRMATLAREAEQSREALAIASEQRVTLLRGLTHDLKNALGAAAGFATLLREEIVGPLNVKQRSSVTRISRIIDQTMVSVSDALLVARTEAGALPVRRQPEHLPALVLESASDYVVAAERADLTLNVECAENLPTIDTDAALVSKIIGNLLSNALKYTPAGGRIGLRASWRQLKEGSASGPWVAVEVNDTGPGIPAALRERVFDEFYRAPAAEAAARGEGIGLAMSRRVARLLGGDISLLSEAGQGATFTLWLPAPAIDAPSTEPAPPPAGSSHDPNPRAAEAESSASSRRVEAPPLPRATGTGAYDRRQASVP